MTTAPVRKAVDGLTLDLPVPVSTNRLWAKNHRGVHKTHQYAAWLKEAGFMLEAQHPGCVNGAYDIIINIRRPTSKIHADLGNFEKGLSDLLQTHGVIRNDKLAESILVAWTDDPTVAGCRVQIMSAEKNVVYLTERPFG